MATKKTKEARVEIVLPDGTKISARGPMAEQMARRLMDPQWQYARLGWPWTTYGSTTNGPPTTEGTYTISTTNGTATANATAEQVQSALVAGFDSRQ
jgi:protein-tyrosine-phosphatase